MVRAGAGPVPFPFPLPLANRGSPVGGAIRTVGTAAVRGRALVVAAPGVELFPDAAVDADEPFAAVSLDEDGTFAGEPFVEGPFEEEGGFADEPFVEVFGFALAFAFGAAGFRPPSPARTPGDDFVPDLFATGSAAMVPPPPFRGS
jgi:hypothetical protein